MLGPLNASTSSTCNDTRSVSFAPDDWFEVTLTSHGAFITLPDEALNDPDLSGLLARVPTAGELSGSDCPADSPLHPVPPEQVLFPPEEINVATCPHPQSPVSCGAVAAWLEDPACDDETRAQASAFCTDGLNEAYECTPEPKWLEDCIVRPARFELATS